MKSYITAIKNLFRKKKSTEQKSVEQHENYIQDEDASATIEIRLNEQSGDFNVVVNGGDMSPTCADTLGLLLYMINSGSMSEFFVEAYNNWSDGDLEREQFVSKVLISWLASKESFETKYNKLAVSPDQVFHMFSDSSKKE